VLHCAGARDCGLEARGLRDQPVGHVAAVTVAADREVIGIGDAVFQQRVDAFENVFAGTRDDDRNDLLEELVAVSSRPAVVRFEDEPAVLWQRARPTDTNRPRSGFRRRRRGHRE